MSVPVSNSVSAPRLFLLHWDGATFEVLAGLASAGPMPNLAELIHRSARLRLRWTGLGSPAAAWTTLLSGSEPREHGVWDDSYLDHRRGWVLPRELDATAWPLLPELLAAQDDGARCVAIADKAAGAGIWSQRPESYQELTKAVRSTEKALNALSLKVQRVSAAFPWRLLQVRVHVLASLQHRTWHLIGGNAKMGGNAHWVAALDPAFRALDRVLGYLLELADQHGAAVAVASPYGLVRSREKITLAELLRRRGLFEAAQGLARMRHRARRGIFRSFRRLTGRNPGRTSPGVRYPVAALVPVDWRRSRAVALHGDHGALVYLNTPERFGTRVLTTARARDQATAEALAALREAEHPVSGEPLFVEAFSTADAYDCDPLDRGWPDVIGIPAAGFQTRHKPDHRRQLLRADPALAATQGGDGLVVLRCGGVGPGDESAAELTDVAPLLLELLMGQRPAMLNRAGANRSSAEKVV